MFTPSGTRPPPTRWWGAIAAALGYRFSAPRPPRELLLDHLAGRRLLLVLRQYGRERLEAAGELEAVRRRHALWWAQFLESRRDALACAGAALRKAEGVLDDLQGAWEWISAHGEPAQIDGFLDGLWRIYRLTGRYQEAVFAIERTAGVCAPPTLTAKWVRWQADALYQMGEVGQGEVRVRHSLLLLSEGVPTGRLGWTAKLAGEIARHAILLSPRRAADPAEGEAAAQAAHAYYMLGQIAYLQGRPQVLVACGFAMANRAVRCRDGLAVARAFGALGMVMGCMRLRTLARRYCDTALAEARRTPGSLAEAFACQVVGIYCCGIAQFERGLDLLDRAARLFAQHHMPRYRTECEALRAKVLHFTGRAFRDAFEEHRRYGAVAEAVGDPHARHWSLVGQAETQLRLGEVGLEQIIGWLEQARGITADVGDGERLRLWGVLALALARAGDASAALAAVEEALSLEQAIAIPPFYVLEGYAGTAEALLALGEDNHARTRALARLPRALRHMHRFALRYPLAAPRSLVFEAAHSRRAGRAARARRLAERAAALARRHGMLYEQALALAEQGLAQAETGSARAADLLHEAERLCRQIGARHEGERLAVLLGSAPPSARTASPRTPLAAGSRMVD